MTPWIDEQGRFEAVVSELVSCDRVGIDTEFHRERTYWPACALVQIAWDDQQALIDPLAVDLAPLGAALRGRTIVMHAAGQDLEVFRHAIGVVPDDLFDTQIAAGFLGMSSIGLAPLVARELGVDLPKADRLTDWLVRPLDESAQRYAAADVAHLFVLHDRLGAALAERGRLDWVKDECRALVERSVTRPVPEEAWWRVKEARRLRGTAAAVAQELAAWRDACAAAENRPVRTILPDLALAGIAQRPPRSTEALTATRGLRERGLAKRHREEIMAAVERGLTLDPGQLRVPEVSAVPSDVRGAVPLLMSWATQRARELELDPAVLATRGDIEAFLRGDENSRLAAGWRREALAADIEALLDGRAALTFTRRKGLVLRAIDPTDAPKPD